MPAGSSSASQRDRSPHRRDREAEMKPLTAGFPGRKLGWQPLSLETVGERERERRGEPDSRNQNQKVTWKEGEMQKTQRPRKEKE